jgi:hypothetical protein
VIHQEDSGDELIMVLKGFFRGSHPGRGRDGCRGGVFGRRGCSRKMWNL